MFETCCWEGDTMVRVVTVVMIMMKLIDENQNIKSVATFLELQSAENRTV
jgi:hypothetical protein